MATGVFQKGVALAIAALLAACQQGTPAPSADADKPPVLRHDDAVLALLQQRYGAPSQLQGEWAQQLEDAGTGHARPVRRDVCADQSVVISESRYRMLAVCTHYDNASSIELGTSDFIVLREAVDGSMQLAAELSGRASGANGQPGSVTTVQVGAAAWAYQVDDEVLQIGARMRNRSWVVFTGNDALHDAGWLRTHLDDHNAVDCGSTGNCRNGSLDLNFDAVPDDSQAQLPYWPLRVHETGRGCKGKVDATHSIAYDPAQARYQIPSTMQIEACS